MGKRNFRSLAEQDVPTHLNILDIGSLAYILGLDEECQLQDWLSKIRYIFESLSSQSYLPQSRDQIQNHHPSSYEASSSHGSSLRNRDQNLFQALIDHLETLDSFEQDDLELLVRLLPQ